MSMLEKNRHQRKGESKAHSQLHKHDSHKMMTVVNHNRTERNHGYESAKRGEKKVSE